MEKDNIGTVTIEVNADEFLKKLRETVIELYKIQQNISDSLDKCYATGLPETK